MHTPSVARSGTVILLVLGLVAALLLVTTLFLTDVLGQRTSGRHYLRQSITRSSALAAQEHALAVLAQQYLDEAGKGATTRRSPYRLAFLPPYKDTTDWYLEKSLVADDEVPSYAELKNNTGALFASAIGLGGPDPTDGDNNERTMQELWGLQAVIQDKSGGKNNDLYTRFIDHQSLDRDLRPTSDPAKTFYRTRYDVLIMNIDPMLHVRPDLGADEYRRPAARSVFANADSRMFDQDDAVENYRRLYARSLASIATAEPGASHDGRIARILWSDIDPISLYPTDDAVMLPGRAWTGAKYHQPGHLVFDDERRVLPWFYANANHEGNGRDILDWAWHDYDRHDEARKVADLFHGMGLRRAGQKNAAEALILPSADRLVASRYRSGSNAHDSKNQRRFPVGPNHPRPGELFLGAAAWAGPGERSFSPIMSWATMWSSGWSDERSWESQYLPFGDGIVDRDPAVDADTMDAGGVPWEINAFTVPPRVLDRMVLGLTPQLLAGKEERDHLDHAGSGGRPDSEVDVDDMVSAAGMAAPDNIHPNSMATVFGYHYTHTRRPANHQFELLFDPPMPDGSGHANTAEIDAYVASRWPDDGFLVSGLSTPYDDADAMRRYAYIAFNPFYDPTETDAYWDTDYDGILDGANPSASPPTGPSAYTSYTQEQADQLYDYLDGLRAFDGTRNYDDASGLVADRFEPDLETVSDPALQARERFLNRLRYIRWVSYKHEFATSDPALEQALLELNAPITYEEGLRYYRRPSALSLRVDVGRRNDTWNATSLQYTDQGERWHFDHSAEQLGLLLEDPGKVVEYLRIGPVAPSAIDSSDPTKGTVVTFPADQDDVEDSDKNTQILRIRGFDPTLHPGINGDYSFGKFAWAGGEGAFTIPNIGFQWPQAPTTPPDPSSPRIEIIEIAGEGAVASNSRTPSSYPYRYAEASTADGSHRYRFFPHTYPGPMWTGREGRAQGGASSVAEDRFIAFEDDLDPDPSTADPDYVEIRSLLKKYLIEPGNGMPTHRSWATDSFAWDVAIAAFEALAEAREQAEGEYATGAVSLTIEDVDRRMLEILGLDTSFPSLSGGTGSYSFGKNVVVSDLFNPAEPVDIQIDSDGDGIPDTADGLYDPRPPSTPPTSIGEVPVIARDVVAMDIDDDGTPEWVPAVRDPDYVYRQYNQYWPVADATIPHRLLDPTVGTWPQPIADIQDRVNGGVATGMKLGAHFEEISDPAHFAPEDFHYDHGRALLMASMLINDFRQSLFGAGSPMTVGDFGSYASTMVPGIDPSGPFDDEIFVAGRNQETGATRAKPFSRTGRLTVKRDRYYRVLVRAQLVNESLPAEDYRDDLTELFLDSVVCVDADENGDPEDIAVLYQRLTNTGRGMLQVRDGTSEGY